MKIAVSASGENLNAQLDPRFGRCQYFIFVDSKSMEFEVVSNESVNAMGGAGIQAAQNIADKSAEVVLTGNMGPNAFQTLSAAGIKVITGVSGTIKDAVEKYNSGELSETTAPNVASHSGMGGGGRGNRSGMGSGKGRGSGGQGGIRKLD